MPCEVCIVFCENCDVVTVSFKIHADQKNQLEYSDQNKHELYVGNFSFIDHAKI
ncbi:hypothetical protein D3C71_1666060 [compost metagenome]